MDCTGGADELAALRGLTVWIWRVVAGHEFVMIDSGMRSRICQDMRVADLAAAR